MNIARIAAITAALVAVTATVSAVPALGQDPSPPPDTGVSSVKLSLGSWYVPAKGARANNGQPKGVPYADGVAPSPTDSIRVVRRATSGRHFSAIGVSWREMLSATVSVAVRTKYERNADWSSWHAETMEETGGSGGRDGTGVIWTGPAVAADVAVTSVRGDIPTDVQADLIDPGHRASDDVTEKSADITLKVGKSSQLNVRSRTSWGADEKQMTWKPEYAPKIQAVVIHHTATTTDYTADQVPAILRSIYRYQAIGRNWGDIGYNIIVDKYGRAWEGRAGGIDKAVIGAHAQGFNTGTAGICLIGNYVNDKPTPQALDVLAKAIAYKLGPAKVDPTSNVPLKGGPGPRYPKGATVTVPAVIGHGDLGNTDCPGKNLEAALPDLRKRAKALLSV